MDTLNHILRGTLGLFCLLLTCYALSSNRRAINWRLILTGVALQILVGYLVLQVDSIRFLIDAIGKGFVALLEFNAAGTEFLFGGLVSDKKTFGYLFAFNVLPTIVFFSAISSLLFYLGVLQRLVHCFAWVLSRTMKLSGAESMSASANIFLGQTEAPLLIRHYLATMTKSELLAIMVGGMATIAGAVMVAYIGLLGGEDPATRLIFAKHLLTASVMSAPAGLVAAKMLLPQTEKVDDALVVSRSKIGANLLEAISNGTTDGLRLALNVGGMLLVFTSFIAMVNALLSYGIGDWTGLNEWINLHTNGQYHELSLQFLFGLVGAPLAWLLGIDSGQLQLAGQVIGEKTVLNEFFAYNTLSKLANSGAISDQRTQLILTYALCGFSNIASIGIQIGGIGALAPEKRGELAQLGVKALIGGSVACFMTACVAGMLI